MKKVSTQDPSLRKVARAEITNSSQNIFSPPSTVSSQILLQDTKTCSTLHHERLITEIVDQIFDAKRGIYEASSSYCSSLSRQPSEYSFDKRLLYWKNVIEERKLLTKNIGQQTGKRDYNVLFNRPVTIDDRDKNTVKRVIDYAERMQPNRLNSLQPDNLKEKFNVETCQPIPEIYVTLPKPERERHTVVEITGMPKITKEEQMGKKRKDMKHSNWFNSKVLQQRIYENRKEIERVVEFYPDIENLQIVGENLNKITALKRSPEIIIEHEDIKVISSETQESDNCIIETHIENVEEPMPEYALRINDEIFKGNEKRSSKHAEFETNFLCEPFDYVVKRIMRIQNMGQKVLSFEFHQRAFFDKSPQLLKPLDKEFCFNHYPFRLLSGEIRDIVIQYQPRKVGIFKEKWVLKTDMQVFCRKTDSITIMLNGKCKPSQEYVDHIDSILTSVLYKSNLYMMRTLTTGLSSITPLLKPDEVICPYKRALTEMEVFEMQNVGYTCDRFHDLELLKNIYKRVKKPRENAWDLNLETLKKKILLVEPVETRAVLFSEMLAILEDMKISHFGEKLDDDDVIEEPNEEKDRAKYVFVRGIITTGIDEWEENAYRIEEAFIHSIESDYREKREQKFLLQAEEDKQNLAGGEGKLTNMQTSRSINRQKSDDSLSKGDKKTLGKRFSRGETSFIRNEKIREELKEEVKHRKFFRDTLYMQTYSHLCDIMENIVSVIESTEII